MNFRYLVKKAGAIMLLTCLYVSAQSQKLINTTGATIAGDNMVVEYSVGEITITAILGPNNFVTQGLLQPNVKVVNADCSYINEQFQYFPNPVQSTVSLVGVYNWIDSYMIYAADGKLVGQNLFINNTIDMMKLASGVYFIQLFPGCNGKYKTLKIVKQ